MIPHPRLRPYHLTTTPTPDGWLLSRFTEFASPAPETVIARVRKRGGDVRRYGWCEGIVEIKWKVCLGD
jgi:hypothetical protein